jgi:hypothetical protein
MAGRALAISGRSSSDRVAESMSRSGVTWTAANPRSRLKPWLMVSGVARVTSLSTSSLGCSWKVTTASFALGVKTRRRPLSLSV